MKKRDLDKNVYDLACERIAHVYDRFDHVAVSFSGGKDSTVVLELTLAEAKKRQKTPLDVVFFDEEAQAPETIEYLERTRRRDGISLRWYCLPVKHRNACSTKSPFWNPWAPEHADKWCRPLPEGAITELRGFDRHWIPECAPFVFPPEYGQVCWLLGIRADESLRRRQSVSIRVHENYIAQHPSAPHVYITKPIYDWRTNDVWTAPAKFGWDYNRAYDVMDKAGISRHAQRVCPPYGEEPLQNLWMYSECWPDLWEKMVSRVPGANTAARYSRSPVYAFSGVPDKPEGMTWEQAIKAALDRWPREIAGQIAHSIKQLITLHNRASGGSPIPDKEPGESGVSWSFLYMIAIRGDLKGRKMAKRADYAMNAEKKAAKAKR